MTVEAPPSRMHSSATKIRFPKFLTGIFTINTHTPTLLGVSLAAFLLFFGVYCHSLQILQKPSTVLGGGVFAWTRPACCQIFCAWGVSRQREFAEGKCGQTKVSSQKAAGSPPLPRPGVVTLGSLAALLSTPTPLFLKTFFFFSSVPGSNSPTKISSNMLRGCQVPAKATGGATSLNWSLVWFSQMI